MLAKCFSSGAKCLTRPLHCAGNALIVVYGPAEVKFTLEQLRLQWTTTSMVVFIVILGLLLGALHWGKGYVARLRAEAQTASVRARWRSKALKEPQYMVFGHAMLFSAYAGLIGDLQTVQWTLRLLSVDIGSSWKPTSLGHG